MTLITKDLGAGHPDRLSSLGRWSVGDGSGWEKHGVGSNGKPSLMGLGLSETTLYIYFTNSGEITSIG